MTNVDLKVEKGKLIVTIDLEQDFGLSSTGKSHTVASTGGFQPIPGTDKVINLNCVKPIPKNLRH